MKVLLKIDEVERVDTLIRSSLARKGQTPRKQICHGARQASRRFAQVVARFEMVDVNGPCNFKTDRCFKQ
jgi:hypothetical protein